MSNITSFASDDIFDSRDVEARIEELEQSFDAWMKSGDPNATEYNTDDYDSSRDYWVQNTDEGEEFETLKEFKDAVYYSQWEDGMKFIAEHHFEDDCREYVLENGEIDRSSDLVDYIDWKRLANNMRWEFKNVELEGETFLYRA